MSEEKQIKFVKRANMWLCAWWKEEGKKRTQEQKWFSTEKEAIDFANSDEGK